MVTVGRHRTGLPGSIAVLAVLLGVLAMHGLSGHGGTHAATAHTSAHASVTVTDDLAPKAPDAVHLGATCLAVLTAGALLLGLLRRRPRVPVAVADRSPVRLRVLRPGRDRDPPGLALLSVRRC